MAKPRRRRERGKIRREAEATKEPRIDRRAHRRLLRFLNAARRAEDLLSPPSQAIQVMPERYTFKGPDFHEAMQGAESEAPKAEALIDVKLARQLIEWREKNTALYGFVNIKQVVDLLPAQVLAHLLSICGPASHGRWDAPLDIPSGYDRPVHAALVRAANGIGKVLFFGLPSGNNTFLWNPNASGPGAFSAPTNQPTDSLFCSGHSFLSDGKLLVVGGGGDGTVTPHHNHGWKFDPMTAKWVRTAGNGTPGNGDMNFSRWYPTCVTLGDEPGRVLVVNGVDGIADQKMEMYFESSDRFEPVWGPGGPGDTTADRSFPQLYPGLHLLPGAEIFYTPTGWHSGGCSGPSDYPAARPSAYFTFSSTSPPVTGSWTNVGPIAVSPALPGPAEDAIDRVKGMAVLLLQTTYPYVQIMVVGGGEDPTSTTTYQMINLSELDPEWGSPLPLPGGLSRVNVNLVLLPNGTVFMCGGRELGGMPSSGGACWIYDPPMSTWYEMDELSNGRRYHSVAVLLPNGKVMVAGNECPPDRTIEVFTPPYLFNADGSPAARPTITSLPDLVHHGACFAIHTPDAPHIGRVVFVRPMAVTHQTDSEQRVIPLSFARTGATTLKARAPNGWHPHAIAPRGYYMLFILNSNGVPSEGKFIYLH
jgi:hypothetical protein